MYDVTKISYTPGDILIFAVDMDTYDIEECRSIYDAILKQAPDVKVVFVPDDLIEEIVHVQKNSPLYYDLATISTTTGYPSNIPQPYLTNISSDNTATIRLDNEGETKLW
jgi:hypothetical protein